MSQARVGDHSPSGGFNQPTPPAAPLIAERTFQDEGASVDVTVPMFDRTSSNLEAAKQWLWTISDHSILVQASLLALFTLWDGPNSAIGRWVIAGAAVLAALECDSYLRYSERNVERIRREQRGWLCLLPPIVAKVIQDAENDPKSGSNAGAKRSFPHRIALWFATTTTVGLMLFKLV